MLLRALQDDVPEDETAVRSRAGRSRSILSTTVSSYKRCRRSRSWSQAIRSFWHADVVHAVENEHKGSGYSNVMYIASTPGCANNTEYLARQAPAFLSGRLPPDFAPDDFEVDFKGRATAGLPAVVRFLGGGPICLLRRAVQQGGM